ncbi:MAG: sulfotransferase [Bacteroidales bacterium]|nr:sulfotransferase [Bacteroidales bacterium]
MGRRKRFKVREHQLYTVLPKVWKELKQENRIDKVYRFRARRIGFFSRLFAVGFFLQKILYSKKIRKISLEEHPPLFILGLWRTGTTHLHYLMACDTRFGYLKNHQAFTFNFSLLSLDRLNKILSIFVPGRRPQDNVRVTLDDPAEDEQPLCTTTTRSSIHSFFFPKNRTYFQKYHLFEGISEQEKSQWKQDYLSLLKSIAFYGKKRDLLLKNPHNTGRVKELLELFPKAKFIFIHRDPYTVFRSTMKLYNQMISSQFLQHCSQKEIEQLILEENSKILGKYLSERELIPEGNLVEIGFDALEKAPMTTMETIYNKLGLTGLDAARPDMEAYLDSVRKYQRNTYRPLPGPRLERIRSEWDFWFKEFGYSQ